MYGPIRLFIGLRDSTRRVLPELRRLDRYERRAAARRDRAVLDLLVEQIEQQLLVAKRAIFSPILMAPFGFHKSRRQLAGKRRRAVAEGSSLVA